MTHDFITALRHAFQQPLPGPDAQRRMASFTRQLNTRPYEVPARPEKEAAVLCLLYPDGPQWRIPLMQRATHEGDKHSGQISFPGGRYEATDPSYAFTALRETEEEFGIPAENIELLGALTPLYIPVSEFLVHPYVGAMRTVPQFHPDPAEVAHILTPSLHELLQPDTLCHDDIHTPQGFALRQVPHYAIEGRRVWGATSMMLCEFLEVAARTQAALP